MALAAKPRRQARRTPKKARIAHPLTVELDATIASYRTSLIASATTAADDVRDTLLKDLGATNDQLEHNEHPLVALKKAIFYNKNLSRSFADDRLTITDITRAPSAPSRNQHRNTSNEKKTRTTTLGKSFALFAGLLKETEREVGGLKRKLEEVDAKIKAIMASGDGGDSDGESHDEAHSRKNLDGIRTAGEAGARQKVVKDAMAVVKKLKTSALDKVESEEKGRREKELEARKHLMMSLEEMEF